MNKTLLFAGKKSKEEKGVSSEKISKETNGGVKGEEKGGPKAKSMVVVSR